MQALRSFFVCVHAGAAKRVPAWRRRGLFKAKAVKEVDAERGEEEEDEKSFKAKAVNEVCHKVAGQIKWWQK